MLPRSTFKQVRVVSKYGIPRFKSDEIVPSTKVKNKVKIPTKEELQWRTPYHMKTNEWYSSFKLFEPEKTNYVDMIKWLRTPIDLRPSSIKNWWENRKILYLINDQKFIPERHEILGSELAAAHFVVHRGGKVKFVNIENWIKRNEDHEYDLPSNYTPEFIIESINCEGMPLYYEGLENMIELRKIRSLSVKGCAEVDDWCLDRISGQFYKTLEELDIRDCPKITENGICALYRMKKLKVLRVNGFETSKKFELIALYLEDTCPGLLISS